MDSLTMEEFLADATDVAGEAALRGAIQASEAMDRMRRHIQAEDSPIRRERLVRLLCTDAQRLGAYLSILHRRGLS